MLLASHTRNIDKIAFGAHRTCSHVWGHSIIMRYAYIQMKMAGHCSLCRKNTKMRMEAVPGARTAAVRMLHNCWTECVRIMFGPMPSKKNHSAQLTAIYGDGNGIIVYGKSSLKHAALEAVSAKDTPNAVCHVSNWKGNSEMILTSFLFLPLN